MTARFSVHSVFHLTGTGPVIAGNILDGTVRAGMLAVVEGSPDQGPWVIAGVGFADNAESGQQYVLLKLRNPPLVQDLRAMLPPGSTVTIGEREARA